MDALSAEHYSYETHLKQDLPIYFLEETSSLPLSSANGPPARSVRRWLDNVHCRRVQVLHGRLDSNPQVQAYTLHIHASQCSCYNLLNLHSVGK